MNEEKGCLIQKRVNPKSNHLLIVMDLIGDSSKIIVEKIFSVNIKIGQYFFIVAKSGSVDFNY